MSLDIAHITTKTLEASHFVPMQPRVVRVTHHPEETIRWEVFLGHLLDAAATRQTETFSSWHVFLDSFADGAEIQAKTPLISVHWHQATDRLFVVRQILTHAFEAFEESPGVIGTRPAEKWVRELVGSLTCGGLSEADVESQLARLVYLAVVGMSRLPITSLESPLPCFSLGELAYFPVPPRDSSAKMPSADKLRGLIEQANLELAARALEFSLRGLPPEDDGQIVQALRQVGPEHATKLLRRVFNQAALAPHTGFAERLVNVVERLSGESRFGSQRVLQLLSLMLRQLYRHLTAFDLTLFHNFGANYPDALFLDALLKAMLRVVDQQPDLALGADQRLLRRAIRAGALLRKQYEGMRVPDSPTSMGENTRVLPAPFARVPEEQITEHGKRRRVLFADDPTDALFGERARPILEQCFDDLDDPRELQELGTALYLDRPLGVLKPPGEVDRTSLVSYVAFSRMVAIRRLATAKSARWLSAERHDALRSQLARISPVGLSAAELQCVERPGVVSVADANKAAADFAVLHSTRGSLTELLALYDWQPLAVRFPKLHDWLQAGQDVLLIQQRNEQSGSPPQFEFFRAGELQFVLSARTARGRMSAYREIAEIEVLTPLRLSHVRDATGQVVEVGEPDVLINAQ